jgi:hypothetical protein
MGRKIERVFDFFQISKNKRGKKKRFIGYSSVGIPPYPPFYPIPLWGEMKRTIRPAPPALLARPWEYSTKRIIMRGIKADFVEKVKRPMAPSSVRRRGWKELSQRRLHDGG